ncbi:MAG: GldG family protein [Bdellovibrionia bacterium]
MSKISKISFLFAGLSLVSMSLIRYILGEWVPFCWLALGFFVFFTGLALFIDRAYFKSFFSMKTTRQGLSMGSMILLVFTALILINILGVRNSKVFDFSLAQANTLSEQSIQLLKGLDSDLKVLFFYKKGVEGNEENRRLFRELIKKYQDQSPFVKLDFVEVNERPDLASEYGVDKGSGLVFLDYQGRRNRIEKIDEQELTSALVKVTRKEDKTVYYVVGHGERNAEDNKEATGTNALKLLLENNRYRFKELPLLEKPQIPEDAALVMIVGPIRQFQEFEIIAIEDYLKRGGSLFLALESQQTTGLERVLGAMGLVLENNYVMTIVNTVLGKGINQGPTVASNFSTASSITRAFPKNEAVLFRYPANIKKLTEARSDVSLTEIVQTTSSSMAFTNLNLTGEGPTGPFTLGMEVKGKFLGSDKEFATVIFSDADFASNQLLYQNLNRDLVLNSIASLVKEENLISITPKEPMVTQMMMSETKFGLFLFGFAIPVPLLLLGLSIGLWYKRRNA